MLQRHCGLLNCAVPCFEKALSMTCVTPNYSTNPLLPCQVYIPSLVNLFILFCWWNEAACMSILVSCTLERMQMCCVVCFRGVFWRKKTEMARIQTCVCRGSLSFSPPFNPCFSALQTAAHLRVTKLVSEACQVIDECLTAFLPFHMSVSLCVYLCVNTVSWHLHAICSFAYCGKSFCAWNISYLWHVTY